MDWRKDSMGVRTESQERLKKAWDGGKESRMREEDCGEMILTRESRLAETSAEWRNFIAGRSTGAAFGAEVRISEPTAMEVMLTAGKWAATLRVTHVAAVELDCPTARSCSFGTEMVTWMPELERAERRAGSAS